ncbi:MAG: DUF4827 domain-containing protein [Prevotella sp.]|jgi:hypothetical protein|nr:DUF4827 domain-containing protein [Prevotella sp.]
MRNIIYTLFVLVAVLLSVACNDYETYGELKEKERDNISQFISDSGYVVIREAQFHAQGDATVGDKQFVYLDKSGVYMQIVRQGCGEKIKDGETLSILCRFVEKSIQDTAMLFNTVYYIYDPDIMRVTRNGSTYSATFTSGIMLSTYGSSVPEGWLVPLQYVNIGRLTKPDDELARVRLIVPHSQGTTQNAKSNVKPYFYDITFQRGR